MPASRGKPLSDALDALNTLTQPPVLPHESTLGQAIDATVRARAYEASLRTGAPNPYADPAAATPHKPTTPAPATRAEIDRTLHSERMQALHAQRDRLRADLEAEQITLEGAATMRAVAEEQWQRAEHHTPAQGDRLERLRSEESAAREHIAAITQQIADVDAEIARLNGAEEDARRRELVATVYDPLINRLVPVVRALILLLKEQQSARDKLYTAHASHLMRVDTLDMPDPRTSDNLLPALVKWLAEAERAGYTGQ